MVFDIYLALFQKDLITIAPERRITALVLIFLLQHLLLLLGLVIYNLVILFLDEVVCICEVQLWIVAQDHASRDP